MPRKSAVSAENIKPKQPESTKVEDELKPKLDKCQGSELSQTKITTEIDITAKSEIAKTKITQKKPARSALKETDLDSTPPPPPPTEPIKENKQAKSGSGKVGEIEVTRSDGSLKLHVKQAVVETEISQVKAVKVETRTLAQPDRSKVLKPSPATLLAFVQEVKAQSSENEAACTMVESKLLRTAGSKAEALVGPGYQSVGIMLFNQSAYSQALHAFDNAIVAFEGSEQALKLNKCAVLKAKTLGLLAHGSAQPQELLEGSIAVLKNVARWLQGPKGDIDPKELKELLASSAYEMAMAHTELGMFKWTERKGSSSIKSSLSTLWKAAKWWSKVLKSQCGEKQIRSAHSSLTPIADMLQVLEYSAQQIAILNLLASNADSPCLAHALRWELAQAYCAMECPERALLVVPSQLACEHSQPVCSDLRDRALVAQAAWLSHPASRDAKEARDGVRKALETRVGVDPGRVRDNFVGLAEAHLALARIYNTSDLSEALHHAQHAERAWQVVFSVKGERSSTSTSDLSSSAPSASSSSSSSTSSSLTSSSSSSSSSHSSFVRLSSTLKRANVWRCLQGFSSCLDLLANLYQRQGSVYHAQHVFTKGYELACELGCENLACRFLLRLARLDCGRLLLPKCEARLQEVRQRLSRFLSSSKTSSASFSSSSCTSTSSTITSTSSSSSSSAPSCCSSTLCSLVDAENLDPSTWDVCPGPVASVLVELQTGELKTRERPLQLRPALEHFGTAEQMLGRRAEASVLKSFEGLLASPLAAPSTTALQNEQKVCGTWLGAVRRSQLCCLLRKDYDIGLASSRDPSVSLLEDCLLTLRSLVSSQPSSELGTTWLCLGKGRLLQHKVVGLSSVWEAKPLDPPLKGLLEETKRDLLNAYESMQGLPSPYPLAEISKSLFELWGRVCPLRSALLLDMSVAISAREHMRSKLREEHDSRLAQIFGRQSSFEAEFEQFQQHVSAIPDHWAVCTLTLSGDVRPHLLVSHLRKGAECVVLRIPIPTGEAQLEGKRGQDILKAFADIMNRNKDSLAQSREVAESGSQAGLKDWWAVRHELDTELQELLKDLEDVWFGPWKGVLLAPETAVEQRAQSDQQLAAVLKPSQAIHAPFLRTLLAGVKSGTVERSQLESALQWTLGTEISESKLAELANKMMGGGKAGEQKTEEDEEPEAPSKTRSTKPKRPVPKKQEADLTKRTAKVDVSSSPAEAFSRHPLVLVLGKELQHLPWENLPILQSHTVCRMPSLAFLVSALAQRASSSTVSPSSTTSSSCVESTCPSLSVSKGCYILNPNQDLPATQSRFEDALRNTTWQGLTSAPSAAQFASSLRESDLFVYIGHAGGQQFLSLDELSRVRVRAAALLMGCSSGSMQFEGDFEAMGVPLSYLLSGCPLVICNLWDVTDKDSDNFTTFLLTKCGVKFSSQGAQPELKAQSLVTWMTEARSQCKLRYLNGAAAVCYGLPLTII